MKNSRRKRTIKDIGVIETRSARLKTKGGDIGTNDKRGEGFDEYNKDIFINDLKGWIRIKDY